MDGLARVAAAYELLPIGNELRDAIDIYVLGLDVSSATALFSDVHKVTYTDNSGIAMLVYYNNEKDQVDSRPATLEEQKTSMQITHGDLTAEVYFGRPADTVTPELILRRREIIDTVTTLYSPHRDQRWLSFAAIIVFDLGVKLDELRTYPDKYESLIEEKRPFYNLALQ